MSTTFDEKNRCRGCVHLKHGETCGGGCLCVLDSIHAEVEVLHIPRISDEEPTEEELQWGLEMVERRRQDPDGRAQGAIRG